MQRNSLLMQNSRGTNNSSTIDKDGQKGDQNKSFDIQADNKLFKIKQCTENQERDSAHKDVQPAKEYGDHQL